MQSRARSAVSTLLFSSFLFVATICGAQTTAICKFSTFQPPSGYSWASPADVNDNGTIVGAVLSPVINSTSFWRGLVRNPDGSTSTFKYPTVTLKNTSFTRMNDAGVTVGYFGEEFFHGFVKSGNNLVKVDYPVGPTPDTYLYGINKWHAIVGAYVSSNNAGFITGSFKLINGKFIPVKIPNATYVYAYTINDNGAIAGSYSKTPFGSPRFFHGFRLRQDGTYVSIDHPTGLQHSGTEIRDLNSAGVMVGNWMSRDTTCPMCALSLQHGFIYKNGQFKNLAYPGAMLTTAMGINNNEVIVGTARIPTNNGGYNIVPFKATCQ
jgi:uncharacterized membrane protein